MRDATGNHVTEVREVWSPTPTTRAVRVAKPVGFLFQSSQAVRFFAVPSDPPLARPLSIASSSDRDYLDFVARHSASEFKRGFFALRPGDQVGLLARRHFLLDWKRPALMLAGGIGITPFRSMLETMAGPRPRPAHDLGV
jgi:ferredoxin-NADP reductase